MSLYLRIAVGDGLYLLDAAHIAEIRPYAGGSVDGDAMPTVDLRDLFAAAGGNSGCAIVTAYTPGAVVALIADRAENLIEIADAAWHAIPPIGPAGRLIDGVCLLPEGEKPLLRLNGESVVAAAPA